VVKGLSASQLRPLPAQSQLLQTASFADLVPTNAKLAGIAPAYVMLAQGNPDQALGVSGGTPQDRARLLRLVAASDGARGESMAAQRLLFSTERPYLR
jgi:hypothetical protein